LASYNFEDHARKITDLNVLNNVRKGNLFGNHTLQTPLYAQQLNALRSVVQENLFAQRKIETEIQSDKRLYDEKIISKREYDSKIYELTKLRAEYESIFQRQRSQWQADLSQFRNEARRANAEQQKITQQKQFYEIKAPVGGTVQQTIGKYEGSLVQAGETLLVISPDSNLLAECYVSPKDIGLLRVGMPVNFQVDAFNYNEWGLLPGEITDIANETYFFDSFFACFLKLSESTTL
jgi:HlyD family secretion protein